MRKIVLSMCVAALIMGGAGCGKKAEEKTAEVLAGKMLEKAMGGKVKVDIDNGNVNINSAQGSINVTDGNVNIQSTDGQVNIASGDNVKDTQLPAELFHYPGATIMVATTAPTGQHFGLESKDESEKVFAAYKSEMEKKGWKTVMSTDQDGEGMLILEKDQKSAQIVISKDDEKTSITIMMGQK